MPAQRLARRGGAGLARLRRRRPSRRLRPDRRARADLGGRPRAQPIRRGDGSVAAGQGRGSFRRSRRRALRPRRRSSRRRRRAARVRADHIHADPRRAAAVERARMGRRVVRRHRARGGDRAGAAAVPAHRRTHRRRVIDTHAHLDACEDPTAILERAHDAGIGRIVTVGTGIESCRAALELAERHEGVYAALGIDPHSAATEDGERIGELRALLAHPRAVAVGETGLDDFHRHATLEQQTRLFRHQLVLADELGKPVVIHSRAADVATAAELEQFAGTVVLHCFSEPGLLPVALERGYYVSFAGNVTYPSAVELREAAALVPADRILAETDSPYLAPQPLRGRTNEPANLVHTVRAIAEVRGENADDLEAQIEANANAAFGLPALDE